MADITKRFEKIRLQLMIKEAFFGLLLSSLEIKENKAVPSMGTDGTQIVYNPDFVNKLTDPELKFVILHELMHVAYLHCANQRVGRVGEREKMIWNAACDFVINMEISDVAQNSNYKRYKPPEQILLDARYRGMSSEHVYKAIFQQQEQQGGGGNSNGKGVPQDSIGGDQGDLMSPMSEEKQEEMRGKVIGAYDASKMGGTQQGYMPAGLERAIEEMKNNKVPWQKIFHKFVGNAMAKNDYCYNRPSRRSMAISGYAGEDIFLPHLFSNVIGDIVVAIDTSGSITQKQLGQFAAEIHKLNHLVEKITAITCDAQVHEVIEVYQMQDILSQLKFKGGGGTAFEPVFEWVEEHGAKPDLLIYLTDSYGSFPAKAPGFPTLFVITQEEHSPIPDWAEWVIMNDDD